MLPPSATIAFIGFGEAGGLLGGSLARRGCAVRSYDILLDEPASRPAMQARIEAAGVDPAFTLADCLRGAKLVVSAVTATSAAGVAATAATLLQAGQVFLDISSVSPGAKRASAARVESTGAHYVEAAVMAPVPSLGLAVPMLLGGPRAAELSLALDALGFSTRAVAAEVGAASLAAAFPAMGRDGALVDGMQAAGIACDRHAPFSGRRLADELARHPRRGELP